MGTASAEPPDFLENTPDVRPVWRTEYDRIMTRFDGLERGQGKLEMAVIEMSVHCRQAADNSLRAYQMAQSAMWMRTSWAPYIVCALSFAMSFAALAIAMRK